MYCHLAITLDCCINYECFMFGKLYSQFMMMASSCKPRIANTFQNMKLHIACLLDVWYINTCKLDVTFKLCFIYNQNVLKWPCNKEKGARTMQCFYHMFNTWSFFYTHKLYQFAKHTSQHVHNGKITWNAPSILYKKGYITNFLLQ